MLGPMVFWVIWEVFMKSLEQESNVSTIFFVWMVLAKVTSGYETTFPKELYIDVVDRCGVLVVSGMAFVMSLVFCVLIRCW